jgi:hypothetical protein
MCAWYTVSVAPALGTGLLAGAWPGTREALPGVAAPPAAPPLKRAPAGTRAAVAGAACARPGTSALRCAGLGAADGTGLAAVGNG